MSVALLANIEVAQSTTTNSINLSMAEKGNGHHDFVAMICRILTSIIKITSKLFIIIIKMLMDFKTNHSLFKLQALAASVNLFRKII